MAVRITRRLADHHTEHADSPRQPPRGRRLALQKKKKAKGKRRKVGEGGSEEEVIRSRSP